MHEVAQREWQLEMLYCLLFASRFSLFTIRCCIGNWTFRIGNWKISKKANPAFYKREYNFNFKFCLLILNKTLKGVNILHPLLRQGHRESRLS